MENVSVFAVGLYSMLALIIFALVEPKQEQLAHKVTIYFESHDILCFSCTKLPIYMYL